MQFPTNGFYHISDTFVLLATIPSRRSNFEFIYHLSLVSITTKSVPNIVPNKIPDIFCEICVGNNVWDRIAIVWDRICCGVLGTKDILNIISKKSRTFVVMETRLNVYTVLHITKHS
jgi:hypothetical protein